jgi:hypothetical protein
MPVVFKLQAVRICAFECVKKTGQIDFWIGGGDELAAEASAPGTTIRCAFTLFCKGIVKQTG